MMRTLAFVLLAVAVQCLAVSVASHAGEHDTASAIADFSLQDFRGKPVSLADFKSSKVVVVAFLGVECPLVKLYGGRLAELEKKHRGQEVVFLGVNSNQQDSLAEIAHFVKESGIEFPLLKDPGNKVADQFGAERTPEVFVLDAQRRVAYQGRIDDQYTYGVQRPAAEHHYLSDAIDALLAGRSPSLARTEPVGCHIGRVFLDRKADSEVTYSQQISRIFQLKCVECHRPGEIGPFALTSYEETVGWAEMIAEVVRERRMPPWHANPEHGKFINDARLSDKEVQQIEQWVEAGAPEGDRSQLPPPREFVEGWRIGKPDLVVKMADKPYAVPAKGEVKYQYFIVDPGFTEDKWVKAAECRPDNRAVVHHIIVAVIPPGGRVKGGGEFSSDWLAATAPGARPMILRDGMAKPIPAGSKLVFQMHYTPNGVAQEDLSCIGLVFADSATVTRTVRTSKAANPRFQIPPGDGNHRVEAETTFKEDSLLLAMFPHMHLRGKSFRYTAIFPDGREQVLLDVPRYDFNWQNGYELPEPMPMPKGTRIHCVAHFDNSAENLANPDPKATVRWGDQTWEEMMIGYFDVAPAVAKPVQVAVATGSKVEPAKTPTVKVELSAALREKAKNALESDEALMEFAKELRTSVPRLDRLCITSVGDGQLKVEQVAQEPAVARAVGGKGATVPAVIAAVGYYARGTKTQTHARLSEARGADMKHMSKALSASVHVPMRYEGKPATVNFWSAAEGEFSADEIALLEAAARELTVDATDRK